MKVEEVVDHLNQARSAHLRWVARAEGLVAGLPLDKDQVPVLSTDCAFGLWYYGDGQKLKGMTSFQAIELPHQLLHKVYMEIFKLLFGEDDRSALSKLFGSKKSYQQSQVKEAEALLPKLRGQSDTLLKAVDLLEREVMIKARGASAGNLLLNG